MLTHPHVWQLTELLAAVTTDVRLGVYDGVSAQHLTCQEPLATRATRERPVQHVLVTLVQLERVFVFKHTATVRAQVALVFGGGARVFSRPRAGR